MTRAQPIAVRIPIILETLVISRIKDCISARFKDRGMQASLIEKEADHDKGELPAGKGPASVAGAHKLPPVESGASSFILGLLLVTGSAR